MNLDDLKEHGGPAFPTHRLQWDYGSDDRELATKHSGMSMRDYFAAKAMQAQLTAFWAMETHHGWSHDEIAREAYKMADAMLTARGQT